MTETCLENLIEKFRNKNYFKQNIKKCNRRFRRKPLKRRLDEFSEDSINDLKSFKNSKLNISHILNVDNKSKFLIKKF